MIVRRKQNKYVARYAIWYHLYNLKNVKNIHGGVLILVKLQALAWNFTKINTPLWVFLTFFKLYEWYQIAQRIKYIINIPSIEDRLQTTRAIFEPFIFKTAHKNIS